MKIAAIYPCCASKHASAGTFTMNGKKVVFVADPSLVVPQRDCIHRTPDTFDPELGKSWREYLFDYNRTYRQTGKNPANLLPASKLFTKPIYASLTAHFGADHFYVLSGGWGIVNSRFLLPKYNITYSRAPGIPIENKRAYDSFKDWNQLTNLKEPHLLLFLGAGREYTDRARQLLGEIPMKQVIVTRQDCKAQNNRFVFEDAVATSKFAFDLPFETTRRTNWQESAALAAMQDQDFEDKLFSLLR